MTDREWGAYVLHWNNRTLYVGKGHDGANDRYRAHRRKRWGKLITSRDWHPADPNTETAAFELERRLIIELRPLANKTLNGRRGHRFNKAVNRDHTRPAPTSRLWEWWPAVPVIAAAAVTAAAFL